MPQKRFDSSSRDVEPLRPSPLARGGASGCVQALALRRQTFNPERVMVCVDPESPSADLVEAGAALAARKGATWYVVSIHVATPSRWWRRSARRSLPPDLVALVDHMGGELIELTATDAATGLIRLAFRQGFSEVIFGPRCGSLLGFFTRSTHDRFANGVPGTTVHVLAQATPSLLLNIQPSVALTRAQIISLAVTSSACLVGLIVVLPDPIAFLIAVALAVGWCIWLERHPAAQD